MWKRILSLVGWIGGALLAMASVSPQDLQSNTAAWLDIVGLSVPSAFERVDIDLIIRCIGLLLLLTWVVSYVVRRRSSNRQQDEIDRTPRGDARSFSQISVHEIATYILKESRWGWEQYSRLNLWQFVENVVPEEMRRAGSDGHVRYIGTLPNLGGTEVIEPAYWRQGIIDPLRIWDDRNDFFTNPHALGIVAYRFGTAPRIDVYRTWPKASFFQKAKAVVWVRVKVIWYYLESKFQKCQRFIKKKFSR